MATWSAAASRSSISPVAPRRNQGHDPRRRDRGRHRGRIDATAAVAAARACGWDRDRRSSGLRRPDQEVRAGGPAYWRHAGPLPTVIGARPNFISRARDRRHRSARDPQRVFHTGQPYDEGCPSLLRDPCRSDVNRGSVRKAREQKGRCPDRPRARVRGDRRARELYATSIGRSGQSGGGQAGSDAHVEAALRSFDRSMRGDQPPGRTCSPSCSSPQPRAPTISPRWCRWARITSSDRCSTLLTHRARSKTKNANASASPISTTAWSPSTPVESHNRRQRQGHRRGTQRPSRRATVGRAVAPEGGEIDAAG